MCCATLFVRLGFSPSELLPLSHAELEGGDTKLTRLLCWTDYTNCNQTHKQLGALL